MKSSMKSLLSIVILLSLVLNGSLFAETAVTASGRRVILNEDGTWEWAKEPGTPDAAGDFRNARWGMSVAEVKLSETAKLLDESDGILLYESSLSGLDVFVGYVFTNGILVRGKYISVERHSNRNDYITDYNTLKDLLTKKYGAPIDENVFWLDDLYRDDYSDWGFAVSLGHLKYFDSWETERTAITAALYGDNYEITHGIEYKSKELGTVEDTVREQAALDEL